MTDAANKPLRYLFIDFNSYFASVEQQENPLLQNRPVAVAPVMSDTTCAIAVSYEAKRFGIRTGTKIADAKRLCPDLLVVPARHELYVDYHHRLIEEIDRHIPVHKVWSIDEMACKLDRTEAHPDAAIDLAHRIKQGIAERVGAHLKSSIGLAPSSLLAKIATDMEKPDGLVVLRGRDLPGRLLDLDLRDLPGVGPRMNRRLDNAGVRSVVQLWRLSPKQARAIWGSVGGERFWYALHGFDIPDQETQRSVIGHSRVLDPDSRVAHKARFVARTLTLKAALRLRRYGLAAGGFMLAGDKWEKGWASHVRFPPTQDSFVFLRWLDAMWPGLVAKSGARASFRHVQIGLFDFVPVAHRQHDLFLHADSKNSVAHRCEELWGVIDKINDQYGGDTLTLASQHGQNLQYAGTKIAFSRVPDRFEFQQSQRDSAEARRAAIHVQKAIKPRASARWGRPAWAEG
ncbi:MAG: type VI secretion protein ImpB [Hyphomicrobiales bacterium]|nr:type VI secretion protein ImpB [Hyphomicrobiales bacterium]